MSPDAIMLWSERHHAMLSFGQWCYTVYVAGYPYTTGTTLEEAIQAMQLQMAVEGELEAQEPRQLLLAEALGGGEEQG